MQLPILCGIVAFLPWCDSSSEPQGHGWQAAKAGDSEFCLMSFICITYTSASYHY